MAQLNEVFDIATRYFKQVWSVPGNHELYSSSRAAEDEMHLRGESKYMACVLAAKKWGVLTPEDEYITWDYADANGEQHCALVCPIFTLYDYRKRLATYRTDLDLVENHQQFPWIPVWDDHEVADNVYRDGSVGHKH